MELISTFLLNWGLVHHHRRILNLSVIDNNIVLCNSPSFSSSVISCFSRSVISSSTDEKVKIDSSLSCISENVKYLITCSKQDKTCKETLHYIGETGRRSWERFLEHMGTVSNLSQHQTTKPVGAHFRSKDHNSCNMQFVSYE